MRGLVPCEQLGHAYARTYVELLLYYYRNVLPDAYMRNKILAHTHIHQRRKVLILSEYFDKLI